MHVLPNHAVVVVTIDSGAWPYKGLSIRGTAEVQIVDGVVPEYAAAARRYFGVEQGQVWADNVGHMLAQMARIAIRPTWVGILDFEQRFPSAIQAAMRRGGAR